MTTTETEHTSTELLRQLEESGAITETALILTDHHLPYDTFEALGAFLGKVNRSCSFWIGDWLNFGEAVYGEKMAQAAEATGLAPQTLINRASVCRHIPPERRKASLAFGIHAEVAYLNPEERDSWLAKAEREQWTRARLREEMRIVRGNGVPGPMGDLADRALPFGDVDILGEPESDPVQKHTCPACGYSF